MAVKVDSERYCTYGSVDTAVATFADNGHL